MTTPKYQYRFSDGSIGESPWKRGADGKHLLNREGGFLEEGAYIGYVNEAGQTVPGLPPDTATEVMGYGTRMAPAAPTPAAVRAAEQNRTAQAPAPQPAPARRGWFARIAAWFARLFS